MAERKRVVVAALFIGAAAGCAGRAPRGVPSAGATAQSTALGCARSERAATLTRLGDARRGSSVALAELGGRLVAIVADVDARALGVVDVERRTELSRTPLPGVPSELLVTADGRVVVALRDTSQLEVLEPGATPDAPFTARCAVPVAAEPIGLAERPGDATLLVASGWGHKASGFDLATMAKSFEVDLPREPRSIVTSGDGRRAFVSHAVGARVSVVVLWAAHHPVQTVSLEPQEAKGHATACQGFALARSDRTGRVFAPAVEVEPGGPGRAVGYGEGSHTSELPMVTVLDDDGAPVRSSIGATGDSLGPHCLLPRAAAVDDDGNELLVACVGSDEVVAYDALAAEPVRVPLRRYPVGAGPSGIAVDRVKGRAIVWSAFDRSLSLIALRDDSDPARGSDSSDAVATIRLAPLPATAASYRYALGRQLFHAVGDPRVSRDGRACASCHPDGRDDALTWATPEGPRRTAMLAGRLDGTAPYGWDGGAHDLREHAGRTFRRLGGKGLSGVELEALLSFVAELAPPAAASRAYDAEVARGSVIFHSTTAGCSGCHVDATAFTDGEKHDVGTRTSADFEAAFDTPSLHFVASHAPFFHDGRHATLHDLLRSTDDRMGHTRHLDNADLDALEAYLGSL